MISRDEAFAQGFRLAWRNVPLTMIVIVLSFLAASAIGFCWELLERWVQS